MSDYTVIVGMVSALLGDIEDDQYATEQIDAALRVALGRYSLIRPNVETQVIMLTGSGLLSQNLGAWQNTILLEPLYLAWPGAGDKPQDFAENLITDWYAYYVGNGASVTVDLQVDGSTLPVVDDYILVEGMVAHTIEGMDMYEYLGQNEELYTSIPKHHLHALVIGAAGYASRAHEQQLSMQAGSAATGYTTTYAIGTLAEQANKFLTEFENELKNIERFSRTRYPWSGSERKRLERI